MGIRIISTGRYLPERVLTNADLEKMVETSDEWIRTRTGIEERHIAAPNEATSDLCMHAAAAALESARVTPEEIGLIVVGTITPDYRFPSAACVIQDKLGAKNAICFDLAAACSGLMYSLVTAQSLMKCTPEIKYALVFGAEKLSSIVNWNDRNTCVLFGDGASAILLANVEGEKDSVLAYDLGSECNYALCVPNGGSRSPITKANAEDPGCYINMNGREVFKMAVNAMVKSSLKTLAKANVSPDELALLVPHQANLRILNAVAQRLGVDDDRLYKNVNRYGNTSAASIGL